MQMQSNCSFLHPQLHPNSTKGKRNTQRRSRIFRVAIYPARLRDLQFRSERRRSISSLVCIGQQSEPAKQRSSLRHAILTQLASLTSLSQPAHISPSVGQGSECAKVGVYHCTVMLLVLDQPTEGDPDVSFSSTAPQVYLHDRLAIGAKGRVDLAASDQEIGRR